ncbi:hypothetical protein SIID45300_02681 [Candidatus Magnetaquicoccaceae bacterium FCR-1]|uniref:O-antigen polymerase n=1 Tax=Candidatus Magnetaquiglobus chichijimensis TaxID=3141448 RepID=A0ABQ0CBS2_9PROT
MNGLTWLGFVVLLAAVAFPGFYLRHVLSILSFFIPFSATAVFNSDSGASLFIGQFFVVVYLFSSFIKRSYIGKLFLFPRDFNYWALVLFALAIVSSMVNPWIVSGGDYSILGDGGIGKDDVAETIPIEINSTTIKYPLATLLGVALAITIYCEKIENVKAGIKWFILGCYFSALWGALQFLLALFGLEYPYWIFNTSFNPSAQGYLHVIDGWSRISSTALEPSIFAKQLLAALPLVASKSAINWVFGSRYRQYNKFALFLCVTVLLLSLSTTAILGLVVFLLLGIGEFWFTNFRYNYSIAVFLIAVAAIGMVIFSYELPVSLYEITIGKMETGSFIARIWSIQNAFEYFLKYPIVGTGWGFVTSNDLIILILANGGLFSFSAFYFAFLRPLWVSSKHPILIGENHACFRNNLQNVVPYMIRANILWLVISFFSGFDYYLLYPYFLTGIFLVVSRKNARYEM